MSQHLKVWWLQASSRDVFTMSDYKALNLLECPPSVPHWSSREATWRTSTSSPAAEIVWTLSARLPGAKRYEVVDKSLRKICHYEQNV